VVSHTDLHEQKLLTHAGRLAALLDSGDASVGPAAWDVASFAYFHGWPQATVLLRGPPAWRAAHGRSAHRASRALTRLQSTRTAEAAAFLRAALEGG